MSEGAPRLIYVLDRFPTDTLNFVYNEIRALESEGFAIEIVSLMPAAHCPDEARDFLPRTRTLRPLPAAALLRAGLWALFTRPLRLAGLLAAVLGDAGSPGKALRSLGHLAVGIAFAHAHRDRREHLHAHFAFKACLAALCAARLNGNRYSFTAHGSATVYPPKRFSLRPKLRGAAFVVAVSEHNRRVILGLCPELDAARVPVNRTGIRLAEFPFEPAERREGPPVILCVASLYPIKNHEALLEACAQLAERGQDFRLDLIGKDEGGRRALLRARAERLGIAGRLRFLGSVDHGALRGHLRRAAVFVLASHSEGVPVSMMEAMAVGLPVVGPRVTGLPELVEEGVSGLLADPARPFEFADAMARILGEPGLAADLAAAARARIEADYDMDANARALARHFREHVSSL